MKKYIGTKEIQAQPMTAEEAIEKGYKVNNHTGDGYEVEYQDGYKSWSPKDVFEKAYKLTETPKDRVVIEQQELESKIIKLNAFLFGDKSCQLDTLNFALLKCQLDAMKAYNGILCQRISLIN